MHDEAAGKADSRIDLNRTGTPLLEIVSEPDMRSPAEAKAYLTELKLLLTYLGVSDCNMQEGSLRVDANVNLHIDTPEGKVATPIVEVKNMNSFRAVERALDYEAERQYRESGRRRASSWATCPSRPAAGTTRPASPAASGSKEESSDYRYFPDPDLVPVVITGRRGRRGAGDARRAAGRAPRSGWKRTTASRPTTPTCWSTRAGHWSTTTWRWPTACGDGKGAANWVPQDVLRTLKNREISLEQLDLPAERLAAFVAKIAAGDLPSAGPARCLT